MILKETFESEEFQNQINQYLSTLNELGEMLYSTRTQRFKLLYKKYSLIDMEEKAEEIKQDQLLLDSLLDSIKYTEKQYESTEHKVLALLRDSYRGKE